MGDRGRLRGYLPRLSNPGGVAVHLCRHQWHSFLREFFSPWSPGRPANHRSAGGGATCISQLRFDPRQALLFFLKAGSLTFGSGLVIVPFLEQGLVREYGWLDPRQFLVAAAIGMISPGPVV